WPAALILGRRSRVGAPRAGAIPTAHSLHRGMECSCGVRPNPAERRYAMNTFFGDRHIPTSVMFGAPLLLAGSAATFLFYRNGSESGRRSTADGRARRQVRDLMSDNPACCRPDTSLREVAEMMVANDCGEIPICDDSRRVIG